MSLPSPALSQPDSLAGIEDLDAFLDAQGKLSRFPTPPLRLLDLKATRCFRRSDALHRHACTLTRDYLDSVNAFLIIPDAFAAASSTSGTMEPTEPLSTTTNEIYDILLRADVPDEVMAIAFSIIGAYQASGARRNQVSPALLTASALGLAVSYTDDHPPKTCWWSRHVCQGRYSPRTMGEMTRNVLASLDWNLHRFTCAKKIRQSLAMLTSGSYSPNIVGLSSSHLGELKQQRLKLYVENTSACWENGQLTPEDHEDSRTFQSCDESPTLPRAGTPCLRVLPLL